MASHEIRSLLHHVIPEEHTLTAAAEHHHVALTIILRGDPGVMSEVSGKTKMSIANIQLYE
jgi:hypothetical protein